MAWTLAAQAVLAGGLIGVGVMAGLPAGFIVALAAPVIVLMVVQVLAAKRTKWAAGRGLAVAWVSILTVLAGLVVVTADVWLDVLAMPPFMLAASAWLVGRQFVDQQVRSRWLALAMTCALSGSWLGLAIAYADNARLLFFASLVLGLAGLMVCKKLFRLASPLVLAANSLILLYVGLPLASFLICGFGNNGGPLDPARKYYSYEVAARHPAQFEAWWHYFWAQWDQVAKRIQTHENVAAGLPFRLRPDSQATLVQSRITINSRGFRGAEFPAEKGPTYRIVALGESTTFGLTITADDQPWPARLEQMIRERLKLRLPVEVINAGVPSYDLKENLIRLPVDILALKPDMIVSYHGINGFHLLDSSLPLMTRAPPPPYRPRPLPLLADAEYRAAIMLYNHRWAAGQPRVSALPANPMDSEYAHAYQQLIQTAEAHGIRLVLANFSMAVNARSDPRVIQFYGLSYPGVGWAIKANEAHTAIVRELAREHPDVSWLDAQPQLDGEHDEFIDLVHFTAEGERQMAENVFSGIRRTLETELSPAPNGMEAKKP